MRAASLIVAPNFDADVVRAAKAAGLAALPGVMTPSEGFAALKAGADGLKLFPAEIIPPAVFKAWRAVFPADTLMLAVGGVGVDNIDDLRGGRCVRLRDRLGALQAGPPGGRNRASSPGRWSRPQRLDFPAFLAYIRLQRTEASRPAIVAREVYCFWGG